MACGCQTQYQRRAGGRYLDDRAGGIEADWCVWPPAVHLRAGGIITGRPGAAPPPTGPSTSPAGPAPALNRCWLPREVVQFFGQQWIRDWMAFLDSLEMRVPAVGGLLADIGGGGVVTRQLVALIQSGCDLSSYSPSRMRILATKLDSNAEFFQNAFVITVLDAVGVLLLGGMPLGQAMNGLAPGMRCAARSLRGMADGSLDAACAFAGCVSDILNVLRGYGVEGAEMVPELRAALAKCGDVLKDRRPGAAGAFGLPTLGAPAPAVSAATGEAVNTTREIGAGPEAGLGLPIAAAAAYLLFLR